MFLQPRYFLSNFKKPLNIKSALNHLQTHKPQPTYIQNTYSQYIFIHCFYCVQLFAIYLSLLLFSFLSSQKKIRVGFVCLFFIFQLKYNFSGIFIGYLWKEIHVDAFSFLFSSSFFVCSLKGRASCALTVPGDNVRIYWDFFLVCWEVFYRKKEEIEKKLELKRRLKIKWWESCFWMFGNDACLKMRFLNPFVLKFSHKNIFVECQA